jgi:hypothetical protein
MYSCGSNGKLEDNFQFVMNLFGDFVQILDFQRLAVQSVCAQGVTAIVL